MEGGERGRELMEGKKENGKECVKERIEQGLLKKEKRRLFM